MAIEGESAKSQTAIEHDAFISYSRRDSEFARALERRLEKYRPPPGLGLPERYLNVFRDETDFIGPDYHESLRRHLSASAALIVLCSPHARASEYVAEEIREFARENGAARIVPILIDGQPNNELEPDDLDRAAFPDALCELFRMPLAANYLDFRIGKNRFDAGEYFDAWHTVLANLFGVSRSAIETRDRKRRARRLQLIGGLSGAIIIALSAALVFALLSRAEAIRQAVAARFETSTRLAVQALERLDNEPETALDLAIEAVEAYHKYGDPPVPRALEALHKARLGFGGSVPAIRAQVGNVQPVWSTDLRWIAQSSDTGDVRFGQMGSDGVPLAAPDDFLGAGERWSLNDFTQLLFTRTGLAALRGILVDDDQWQDKAAIWHWPIAASGDVGTPQLVAKLDDASRHASDLIASPDGRWLSWSDGGDLVYLRALGASGAPVQIAADRQLLDFRAFSEDSTEFAAMTQKGIQIVELRRPLPPVVEEEPAPPAAPSSTGLDDIVVTARPRTRAAEHIDPNLLEAVPARLLEARKSHRDYAAMTLSTRYGRRREDASYPHGIAKVAVITEEGDVEYWNLDETSNESTQLGSVFSAYAQWMRVGALNQSGLDIRFNFSPAGSRLLAAVEHDLDEFGIASWIDLSGADGWKPLPADRPGPDGSIARTESGVSYNLMDLKRLGVSDAAWLHDSLVLTQGMDGTLWQWDIDSQRNRLFDENVATFAVPKIGEWLVIGTSDGKIKLRSVNESDNVRELRVFDAPVYQVAQAGELTTIVATNSSGDSRFWSMQNPVYEAGDHDVASLDWRWFAESHGRGPRFWDLHEDSPFRQTVAAGTRIDPNAVTVSPDGRWAAGVAADDANPGKITVSLSHIQADRVTLVPELARQYDVELPEDHTFSNLPSGVHVDDVQARLLLSSGRYSRKTIWQVNLLNEEAVPLLIVDADAGLEMRSTTLALDRMLVGESRRNGGQRDSIRVLDLDDPTGDPLIVVEGTASAELSPDGRWLEAGQKLFDLSATSPNPVLDAESMDTDWPFDFLLGPGRLPLFIDREGQLWGIDSRVGSSPVALTPDVSTVISEVAWDDSARWLALGSAEGDVWMIDVDGPVATESLRGLVHKAILGGPLPAPWLDEARAGIASLDLLPGPGMVLAETSNDHYLLWQGDPDGGWSDPIVFDDAVLHRAGRGITCRADGRQCLIGGQFISFIEEQALQMARDLRISTE